MSISTKLRQKVYEKYNGKCAYSGTPLKDDWQIDHVVPKILFGPGVKEDPDDIGNLMPVQKIINHYKRSLTLRDFKKWYLGGLHERLKKLPRYPKVEKTIKHKRYLLEIAELFDIKPDKPFSGKLYFEKIDKNIKSNKECK